MGTQGGNHYELRGEVRKAISVLKMRSGGHERAIRELIFERGRLRVGAPLRDLQGILTGVPTLSRSPPAEATGEDGRSA